MNIGDDKEYISAETMMGPNSVRILAELFDKCPLQFVPDDMILDLGCGTGLTSLIIAKETGARVFANDLWVSTEENEKRFVEWGVGELITPVCEDANDLHFEKNQFRALISIDSYHYFAGSKGFFQEKILPFISNYRLNVFDYHEYDDFSQFHSELQSFFEFLRYSGDKEKLKEKLRENRENYGSLSAEAKALLVHLTNIKEIPNVGDNELEKGEFDMCKAFEDMKEEGRTEGKIEGKIEGRAEEIVEMGYEFGLSENEIMERLQNKLDISVEEAEKYLGMFKRRAV